MASQITLTCDFIFGFLRCDFPEDTIHVDLKIYMQSSIYIYGEDRHSKINKFTPWGSEVTPFASLKRKMTEFIGQRQAATHFNRFCQPQLKATIDEEKESTLINSTKSSTDNKWQPRKVSVELVSPPRTWLEAMNIKRNAAIKYRDEHT